MTDANKEAPRRVLALTFERLHRLNQPTLTVGQWALCNDSGQADFR